MAHEHLLEDRPEGVTIPTDECCAPREVTAYIDGRGRLWRSREDAVRFGDTSTHTVCEQCHRFAVPRAVRYCSGCREARDRKGWEEIAAVRRREWDGREPIVFVNSDLYFFDEDALYQHLLEFHDDPVANPPLLVYAVRSEWRRIDPADIADMPCDDPECLVLPDPVEDLIDVINGILANNPPSIWAMPRVSAAVAVDVSSIAREALAETQRSEAADAS